MQKRYLIKGLIILIVFFLLVGGRVFYLQRSHYMNAEKYYAESNWKIAIREYDLSMHFYTPWSPYVQKSAERLWQIGEMFEKQNKPDWAVIAYSSIRSSFYASRSFYTPGKDWIKRCDDKIADLNVKILVKEGSIKPEESNTEKEKFLHVMRYDRAPDPLWAILVEIGFFGWIASILFIIIKGFTDRGQLRRKPLFYGLLAFSFTFSLWVISLLKA